MKNIILVLVLLSIRFNSLNGQYSDLIQNLPQLDLPFAISSFNCLISDSINDVEIYNKITDENNGYFDHNGKFHRATGRYSEEPIERLHEKYLV